MIEIRAGFKTLQYINYYFLEWNLNGEVQKGVFTLALIALKMYVLFNTL